MQVVPRPPSQSGPSTAHSGTVARTSSSVATGVARLGHNFIARRSLRELNILEMHTRSMHSIREDDLVYIVHMRVFKKSRVDEEEHGHVDFFVCPKNLFLKAETLDFMKIDAGFERCNVVRRHSNRRLACLIFSREKCKSRFPWDDVHFATLRLKFPRHGITCVGIEANTYPSPAQHRLFCHHVRGARRTLRCATIPCRLAKYFVQWYCCVCQTNHSHRR